MSDLIYRQDAIALVENSYYNLAESIEDTWAMVSDMENLPPAEPEIIRCKDCKWSDWYIVNGERYCYCTEIGMGGRTEDDYCSYAERRTDD